MLFHISHFTFHISKIFVLLTLFSSVAIAQDNSAVLRSKLDRVFARIDKSQISTGILEDAGFGWLPLTKLKDTMSIDNTTFRMAYESLYSARISGTQTLTPLEIFNERFLPITPQTLLGKDSVGDNIANNPNIIEVAVINYNFNSLRPDALTANLMTATNGQLRDVAGRTQSPYQNHNAFLLTTNLHTAKPQAYTGDVSFLLRRSNYFSNTGKTILKIEADLGNGNWRTVEFDQSYSENYCCMGGRSFGWKTIKYRFTFTDNTVFISQTKVNIQEGTRAYARYAGWASRDVPIFDPTGTNQHSGGTMQIVYSQRNPTRADFPLFNRRLIKPLIVIEGFDASAIMPFLADGDYNVETFLNDIARTNRDIPAYDFSNQLDDIAGYDLVFLNFADGTDDIHRNAQLLQDVLRWVNANKIANAVGFREQNVVLGLSMGGLVGRYGLAEMEKKRRLGWLGNEHDTRLLLTHDSPHRGANVPLGVQALAAALRTNSLLSQLAPQVQQVYDLMDAPASRQMSIYRASHIGISSTGQPTFPANTFLDGAYRQMITFPAGQEAPYQFVATSNGAECGTRLFAPYTELARGSGTAHFLFSPFAAALFPVGLFDTDNKVSGECIVNALPNQQTRRISSFRLTYSYKILGLVPIDVNIYNYRANSLATHLPIDGMAGGTFAAGGRAPAGVLPFTASDELLWGFVNYNAFANVEDRFCFVPHYSALDIEGTAPSVALLNTAIHANESPKRSTARNFLPAVRNPAGGGAEFNQPHIQFTNRNARWLFSQMEDLTPQVVDCFSAICNPASIVLTSNKDIVCFGQEVVMTLSNLPTGATISWSISNNLLLFAVNGTSSVTFTPASATSRGWVTVTAVINSAECNNFIRTVTRRIWVGEPRTLGLQTRVEGCYMVITPVSSGATDFDWELSHPDIAIADYGTNSIAIHYADWVALNLTQITVTCRASNACNPNTPLETVETFSRPAFPLCPLRIGTPTKPVETIKTYPNPTAGTTYITLPEGSSAVQAISVRNSLGVEVLNLQQPTLNENKELALNLGSLPDGLYVVGLQQIDGSVQYVKVVVQKGGKAN